MSHPTTIHRKILSLIHKRLSFTNWKLHYHKGLNRTYCRKCLSTLPIKLCWKVNNIILFQQILSLSATRLPLSSWKGITLFISCMKIKFPREEQQSATYPTKATYDSPLTPLWTFFNSIFTWNPARRENLNTGTNNGPIKRLNGVRGRKELYPEGGMIAMVLWILHFALILKHRSI